SDARRAVELAEEATIRDHKGGSWGRAKAALSGGVVVLAYEGRGAHGRLGGRDRGASRSCGCGGGAVSEACRDLVRDLAGRDDVQEYTSRRSGCGGRASGAADAGVGGRSATAQASRIGSRSIGSARCSLVGDRGP